MRARSLHQGEPGQPWLILLHGLLGSGEDWRPILPFLNDRPVLLVDLPGHGDSRHQSAEGFDDVSRQLTALLVEQSIRDYWLLGYSLGGRIAMFHACHGETPGLRGLLVEGGHPGLATTAEREARAAHDARWARRFAQEPLAQVLADWYRQPVFAHLNCAQRQALIERRSRNDGAEVAGMLIATSLSRQPPLSAALRRLPVPFGYLCGERDIKFQTLARREHLPLLSVADCGHNAHQENPADYAARIRSLISLP
ncbi:MULTISPECIES: 2-succinyl-6-hydroxy-2,4-cyclohexadiene-1-carboxylate synthase [Lonsdalea]|uniref:2-succinyl-6-hydroxy-2, 4-cyclohexadiene-1-carboxylate synthase n=2 Tax=Lonsdalea TaxID=1082702 RepID=A0ACD1JD29_9GAMM|nr:MULTISPECIES: 2-succinyl-6-hydroxy-2,4-cyclohexadiene-1-carboxylate synthase [Lonsdalea]OSM96421.1 2-succinyl-6-hydroxy-2,4-cyclohexadiene-1-carboxylate synthase [Lonsdalea populi]OSN01157.1 2-succinyl-6-hydroxy-2,4-cyclohexadiene-1-carboxylate synthase [Lonsdalea populi]QPQ25809.1 2-succinyl-6-hydroxy-2,4-cyclohexadiene-1-carboxylate synthase [Lonsdalea populi]RAT12353.1 2-succinyl-6-hydroxy-2,4-cyclohexadiene-1-carboxylate synthase [Lonsdalea quercina]RAT20924.1 2-succinyl-6-hydroxy-2,4-c